jgi:DNA-directed RNA polymerase II subunit RPB2
VDRGSMSITAYHTMFAEEEFSDDVDATNIVFYDPQNDENQVSKQAALDFGGIGHDGIILPGTRVTEHTVVFAMKSSIRDRIIAADKTTTGIVDRTYLRRNVQAKNASVVIRDFRHFTIGDKAASRFYNKGVVGMLLEEYEMPWTADGLVPDIVVNAHAFPTRMTVGQLLETAMSAVCCNAGGCMSMVPLDDVSESMQSVFEHATCETVCYSPTTGKQMQENMFMGMAFYIRLKQQVADKMASRSYGRVDNMTMQPVQGRANEGGLKIGNMEASAILSHGAFGFMKECMMDKSDGEIVRCDTESGIIPAQQWSTGTNLAVPRSLSVFAHEIRTGLGVGMRVNPDKNVA